MAKFTDYQPLEDRVLIKPIKKTESEITASGIITDMKKKEVTEGEVVAVGGGRYAGETGVFMPTVLAKGDIVLYGINQGMKIDIPNAEGIIEEHIVIREGDVLFLISRKENTQKFEMNGSSIVDGAVH